MKVLFTPVGWEDYLFWQKSDGDRTARINDLINDIRRSPFRGIGKPEPLRGEFQGWWSRRINSDHRLVYRITETGQDQRVEISVCRYHYARH